jgi:hypothetical protein
MTNASTLAGAKKKWIANFRLNQNSELISKGNLGTTGSNGSVLKEADGEVYNIQDMMASNQYLSSNPFPASK